MENAKEIIEKSFENYEKKIAELNENLIEELVNKLNVPQEENAVNIPNNKIILSAEVFANIVNVISYAQNNNLVDNDTLNKIFEDVKNNRTVLTKSDKESIYDKKITYKPRLTLWDLLNDLNKTDWSKNETQK